MQPPGHSAPAARHVRADVLRDTDNNPKVFTLTLGSETVHLDPGKSWVKVDAFKWVTRGLIEPPQSFHVLPGGEVDINGEKIRVTDPDGVARLEHEINKKHVVAAVSAPRPLSTSPAGAGAAGPGRIHFRVHLDHLGHLAIEARRGEERVETGLRGLASFVHHGLMTKPESIHVDPLQRAIEIDGHRYECSEAGARELEAALNDRYAPRLEDHRDVQIEVRENAASPTGFDLSFPGLLAGTRVTVKGHLSQEKLDILTDEHKCELLRAGIVLRLSPPRLLVRQRRPDGGEEGLPELPDLDYLRSTTEQLQQALNHPLIRRGRAGDAAAASRAAAPAVRLTRLKVVCNPQNRLFLWLECYSDHTGVPDGKAFTHHNVAELQHQGVFKANLDVALSLDHRRLSVLDKRTRDERHLDIGPASTDAELGEASWLLTEALAAFEGVGPRTGG